MSLLKTIQQELARERAEGRAAHRIRVTRSALKGSPVCLPIQSKRWQLGITPERRTELLLHPDDWHALLLEMPPAVSSQWCTVLGMPVLEEAA